MNTAVAREQSRFMQKYAKEYHAGAFATPTAKEISNGSVQIREWGEDSHRFMLAERFLDKVGRRRDFTGRQVLVPPGSWVATHVARAPRAEIPDLSQYDFLTTYVEDSALTTALRKQGRGLVGIKVSAASEILGLWGRHGDTHSYPPYDVATVVALPVQVPPHLRTGMLAEVEDINAWHDDFPYYSDGSWSAVSLRGFRPDDPRWGIKPAEMSRAWKAEHPEALGFTCQWTVLADRCPTIVEFIEGCQWGQLERVRLLQMAGRGGKGGILARHTDITDRAAGTSMGQIARFHTPLITHPDIKMHAWDLAGRHTETHLEQWGTYYLDARKPHAVTNPTGIDRIHLVVDVVVSPDTLDRISAAHSAASAA